MNETPMAVQYIKRSLLLSLMVMLVSACGFHLRGTGVTEVQLTALDVTAQNQNGPVATELRRALRQYNIEVNPEGGAEYQVQLLGERNTRRAISTTSQNSVGEFEIRLELDFMMFGADGEEVIPLSTIFSERTYAYDRSSLVASDQEQQLITSEIQRDLVEQLIRRVNATVRSQAEGAGQSDVESSAAGTDPEPQAANGSDTSDEP
ncbi:MAG: hypothetical protein KDI36_06295 [Pseudomonadales bacterium]|nr:hypothetical protein [Pseudomonadales bacterium]